MGDYGDPPPASGIVATKLPVTTDFEMRPAVPAPKKSATTKAKATRRPAPKKAASSDGAATALAPAPPKRRRGGASGPDLVIVESPAKASTINKYLGTNFKVLASYGHVRDLPKGRRLPGEEVAGVNITQGWIPRYEVPKPEKGFRRKTAQQILSELKKE